MPSILAFAGSARTGSYNKKLLAVAAKGARDVGATVTVVDLRDLPMPIYDGDAEASEGLPANAKKLKALMAVHQGLLIASPEYNSSIAPLLKNAIDWASRSMPGEAGLASYQGKTAALISASPGGLGGLRGLFHLRDILQNIGVTVLPDPSMVAIPRAHEAFAEDGSMKDAKVREMVERVGRRLAEVVG